MLKPEVNEKKATQKIAKFYVSEFGKNAFEEFTKMNSQFLEDEFFKEVLNLIKEMGSD